MNAETMVRLDRVSKRFIRSLRLSMWYGAADILKDLVGASKTVEHLRRNEFWAVRELSMEVRRGEFLGLIGPNGAGKSTLLKMLNGIFMPDHGRIEIQGRVGALIELGAGFHPMLTGRENIYINGAILGMKKKEIDFHFDSIVAFAGLADFIDTPVKFYSSGMYVRLGFAVAAHLKPQVLLLDEVLAVGDVAFQAKCFNTIGQLREQGATVILVSHNMHRVASFCDRVAYLNRGQLKHLGETQQGIELYTEDMLQEPASGLEEEGDLNQVNGSGRVIITDVQFLNPAGERVEKIRCGAPVVIRVYYSSQEEVEDLVLDLAIRDTGAGLLFQATNRDFGVSLGKTGSRGYFEVTFHRLDVNNQFLYFFVALWDAKHYELFDWKRNFKLKVEGNPMSSGRMMFDCQWRSQILSPEGSGPSSQ